MFKVFSELVGPWHASGSALESGISNFKLSCKSLNLSIFTTPKKFEDDPLCG